MVAGISWDGGVGWICLGGGGQLSCQFALA